MSTGGGTGTMDVLHVTRFAATESIGGQERYVAELIDAMARQGVAPGLLHVRPDRSAVRVTTPDRADSRFRSARAAIERLKPRVVHFHGLDRGTLRVFEGIRTSGIAMQLTIHQPGDFCRRQDLRRYGEALCAQGGTRTDCTACKLHHRFGLPASVGERVAPLVAAAEALASVDDRDTMRALLERCARVYAPTKWAARLATRRGASPSALRSLPVPSVRFGGSNAPSTSPRLPRGPLRVLYLGRQHPVKGAHLLIDAVLADPVLPIELRIVGPEPRFAARSYPRSLRARAAHDPRIHFAEPAPLDGVAKHYAWADVLAVPSVWPEAGPMVVPEAWSQDVPVLASGMVSQRALAAKAGGLVEPNTVEAWRDAFRAATQGLPRIPASKAPTFDAVACTVLDGYREVGALAAAMPDVHRTSARVPR